MERLQQLFILYYNKTATEKQREELMQLINNATEDQLENIISECGKNLDVIDYSLSPEKAESILQHILQTKQTKIRKVKWWNYAAAASVIFLLVCSYLIFFFNKTTVQHSISIHKSQAVDVLPGSFKAKLTLDDGKTIVLDSAASGELAKQGNTEIINKDGKLVYEDKGQVDKVVINMLSTSKGETYTLNLADGSIVYLNSASSIKFPVSFPGKERRIEISGEAYFKVAKNPNQPFIVSVNGMEVQALGTEFNINAYPDEVTVNTTLIEGSVRVANHNEGIVGTNEVIIKPGQQTQLKGNRLAVIRNVNIDEVVAWKAGYFYFESVDLKTVMRQFSRWYNIEVVFEGPERHEKYFSIIKRNTSLLNVLKSLQANDIKFKLEGNKLICY